MTEHPREIVIIAQTYNPWAWRHEGARAEKLREESLEKGRAAVDRMRKEGLLILKRDADNGTGR